MSEASVDNSQGIIEENNNKLENGNPTFVRLSKAEKKAQKKLKLVEKKKLQFKLYKERRKERQKLNPDSLPSKEPEEIIRARLQEGLENGINICIELDFDRFNNEIERKSLAKQLSLTYGILKRASNPLHMHLCSFGCSSELAETLLKQGVQSWIIDRHESPSWESFPREKLIILSPDAEEYLNEIETDKIYVIGGIVDKSIRKNESLNLSHEKGLVCKKLPIQVYFPEIKNFVLNIDQCVKIISNLVDSHDWKSSLEKVIPKRKL